MSRLWLATGVVLVILGVGLLLAIRDEAHTAHAAPLKFVCHPHRHWVYTLNAAGGKRYTRAAGDCRVVR